MSAPATTARAAVGMGAIAAISRVIGFVRVLVVAGVLGTTYLGNAFQAANSFSNVLFELLAAGALSAVLVPAFVGLLEEDDEPGAEAVAGGVLGAALAVLGGVTVVGILASPLLARLLTLGVPAEVAAPQRELVTFLLVFFIPQVVLYAAGAIATGVLYAKRRFAVTAAAPIGNTVVMVACLLVFRAVAGPAPELPLGTAERWLLVAAGSGGVVAFVGTLLWALRRTGFRLRPRWAWRDPRVRQALAHSGWGAVLHTGAGLLLGGAIITGSAVEGGVVAYQVAYVFFLAPYAILAQPIHTAILPELVAEARSDDPARFQASVRWALERMAVLVVPVSALIAALALPAMRAVSFGETADTGAGLLAAALAAMAVGLFPYGAFLLLARACYALGDSRTPGVVSVLTALVGVAVMVLGALTTSGTARVATLGAGHTAAHLVGALWLFAHLSRRTSGGLVPAGLVRMVGIAAAAGTGTWLAGRALLDDAGGRATDLLGVAGLAVAGLAAMLVAALALGLRSTLTARRPTPPPAAVAGPSPEALP
ncbi:MAG TPA: lipid II flippase MurJ [Acidimicrobiales bacterium]|nr:lipid II flippase MurJ [Acidimicrobiales bacterium]